MKTHRFTLAALCSLALAACDAGTDDLTTQADSLLGAQCRFDGFKAAADACFATFDACVAVAGADVEACKAGLFGCLPPPPRPPPPPDHQCDGSHDGPPPPPPGSFDGGLPPPPPDGQLPPPPPPGDGGQLPPPGGHHPRPPPPPLPDPAAIEACHAAFDACLTATPTDSAGCREAHRICIGEAFKAAFQARCDEAAVRCAQPGAPADRCAEIAARCAEGVQGPPPGPICR